MDELSESDNDIVASIKTFNLGTDLVTRSRAADPQLMVDAKTIRFLIANGLFRVLLPFTTKDGLTFYPNTK